MPATKVKSGWSAGNLYFYDSSGNAIGYFDGSNRLFVIPTGGKITVQSGGQVDVTVGTSGLNVASVARAKYSFASDGGAQGAITPLLTAVIPDNAIVFGALVNAITAPLSGGSATIAIGTTAGSAANSIKAATAVATYTVDSVLAGTPVFTAGTAFKMTAAGSINITVATADLTAGVIEITVFYVVASA